MSKNITIAVLSIACLSLITWGFAGHREVAQADQNEVEQQTPTPELPARVTESSGGFLSTLFRYSPAADSVPNKGDDFTKEAQYIYDSFGLHAFKSLKITNSTVEEVSVSRFSALGTAIIDFSGEADIQLHQGPVFHVHFWENVMKVISNPKPTYGPKYNFNLQNRTEEIMITPISDPHDALNDDIVRSGLSIYTFGRAIDRYYADSEYSNSTDQQPMQNWIDYNSVAWSNRNLIQ